MSEWRWIERYAEQFRACAVRPDETTVVLSETTSRISQDTKLHTPGQAMNCYLQWVYGLCSLTL